MARSVQRRITYALRDKDGYHSDLERRLAKQMEDEGIAFTYEGERIPYVVPTRNAVYLADFVLPNGIIIEAKGYMEDASDRQKMILVKEQNPDLDIRFVFQKASTPIYKGSKTTYAKWAESHGFPYAEKRIPEAWLKEAKEK